MRTRGTRGWWRVTTMLVGGALALSGATAATAVLADRKPAPTGGHTPTAKKPRVRPGHLTKLLPRSDLRRRDETRSSRAQDRTAGSTVERYSILQMNLCLSGFAGCYDTTDYPNVVEEAIGVIAARKPRAVTFNEACSGDVARIAQATRYHARFAPVRNRGRPLRCVDPGGRGVFGNAVITKRPIDGSTDQAYAAQAGNEERRWICVETVRRVNVCTTHLSTRHSKSARAASDAQCEEFAAVLAARGERGPVVAAGDINRRRDNCAPRRMWARTDAQAVQLPGRQHVYGGPDLSPAQVESVPATYTDHDFLLVRTRPATSTASPTVGE